jgi:1-acyl-sn-glycerol-3-phosphate acyltransferase
VSGQPLEGLGPRWGRRALTIPLLTLAWLLAVAALPCLPLVALLDLCRGTRLAWARAYLAVLTVLTAEVLGLAAAASLAPLQPWVDRQRWLGLNARLQRRWVGGLLRALRTLYGISLRVHVEGQPERGRPLVVLARHVSLVDTLLPLQVLDGWRLRFVLKRELLWDPCLDVVGQRLPNAFVRRGSGEPDAEIARVADLAAELGAGDGVVLFPEGTRYTPAKRQQVLASLERAGRTEALERTRQLRHVLPPRLGGVTALLSATPTADVVLLSHTGLEGVHALASLCDGSLIGREIQIRLDVVPAASVPRGGEDLEAWIWEAWGSVDAWLERRSAPRPASLAAP